jgi:hypothetical protein
MGSLLTFAAYAHRKKLGRSPERPLPSSSPFSSRLQRRSAFRPYLLILLPPQIPVFVCIERNELTTAMRTEPSLSFPVRHANLF